MLRILLHKHFVNARMNVMLRCHWCLINRAKAKFNEIHFAKQDAWFQGELEEANQKEGSEIEDARSTIGEVEHFFQTEED